ncbi:MAG: PAS domain-containing sensor histidine kinase [Polyangiales bacterium]
MPRTDDAQSSELFDSAPCGLLSTAADGTIVRANHTLCRWLGFTSEALVGRRRFQDLLAIGSKIYHETHWLPLLVMQGEVLEVQLELVHRAGHTLPMLVNAARRQGASDCEHQLALFLANDRRKYERELLDAHRQTEALLADVRSAKEALTLTQARLHLALESANLLAWDLDLASGEPRFQPGVERLLGLPPGSVITADGFRACIQAEDRAREAAALASALRPDGDGSYVVEYRLLGHDGHTRVAVSRGRASFDAGGLLTGFSGVLQEVTQWRKVEHVLREQEQQAKQRALLAEQLVGIVSHDLSSPLQAAALAATWLIDAELPADQARVVRQISAAVGRAIRLIADLLDFTEARLGDGLRVSPRPFDVHLTVSQVIDELAVVWRDRVMEHDSIGSGSGYADPDRIAQAVTNLVSNALSYGAADRPVIITSSSTEHQLSVRVHNEGPAIAQDLLPHIFEPLCRGEREVKLGSRSVGLGLYIVQQIALAHGGTITVCSTPAAGTTFTLTLPQHRPSEPPSG